MITWQDFVRIRREAGEGEAVAQAIEAHEASDAYRTALEADLYDRQRNRTINEFVQKLFTSSGARVDNFVASNNRKASNFFNILNTQRNSFLLGNGVTFTNPGTKARLGDDFDNRLFEGGYYALIHGAAYLFFNVDRVHVFPMTQFAPLWDEQTGALRGGVRAFSVMRGSKCIQAELYEEAGVTRYRSAGPACADFVRQGPREPYVVTTSSMGECERVLHAGGYGVLPIVPLYGSRLHQSTLVGMKQSIDSYDIIANGWCNDVRDCAQVYWILENYAGMSEADLNRFRDRLLTMHIAAADTGGGGAVRPYAQDVPYESRDRLLTRLREDIYRDFGALDAQALSAGNMTATAIRAAYEALGQKADDLEMQVIACVQGILRLMGIRDTPIFKRCIVVNEQEQVRTVMLEAGVLDRRTLLGKLPNITPDEVDAILQRKDEEAQTALQTQTQEEDGA